MRTPEQAARLFYHSLAPGTRHELPELLDPLIVLELPDGFPGCHGRYVGYKAYLEDFLLCLYGTFDVRFVAQEFLAAGENVTVLGRIQGFALATGSHFDVPFAHVWTVRDGRLVRGRFFSDTAVLDRAAAA